VKDPEGLSAKVAGLRNNEAGEKENGIIEVVSPDAVKHVWAETIALQDYLIVPDHTDNEE